MSTFLPPLRLTGAQVLRDASLQDRSIAIASGRITKGPLPAVDMTGFLVLPGVIDLMAQQPVARQGHAGPDWVLQTADRQGAASGVTTQFLCQGWSWEGPLETPSRAAAMAAACIHRACDGATDLRLLLRIEHLLSNDADRLVTLIQRHGIAAVMFSDRAGWALETAARDEATFAALARSHGMEPEVMLATLEALKAGAGSVPRALCQLAERFDSAGVIYGSVEDATGEAREHHSMIGAQVCMAPRSRRAAAAARAVCDPVVLSAADVMEQLRTRTLETGPQGLACAAIASDGAPTSLAALAFDLADSGAVTLPQAWALISEGPARVLRMTDRGRLELGCRADMTIINARTRLVEATIAGGTLAYLSGEAGARFLASQPMQAVAAE